MSQTTFGAGSRPQPALGALDGIRPVDLPDGVGAGRDVDLHDRLAVPGPKVFFSRVVRRRRERKGLAIRRQRELALGVEVQPQVRALALLKGPIVCHLAKIQMAHLVRAFLLAEIKVESARLRGLAGRRRQHGSKSSSAKHSGEVRPQASLGRSPRDLKPGYYISQSG